MNDKVMAVRADGGSDEKLIDLWRIVRTIQRRWLWIVATIGVVGILTLIAYIFVPRSYTVTSSIALDRRADDVVQQANPTPDLPTDSPSVDTAVQVLTSSTLAGEVANRLGLANRIGYGQTAGAPPVPADAARRKAANAVASSLVVKRVGTSYAITVSYTGADPALSTAIVNAVADQYVSDQRTGKEDVTDRSARLLRDRLAGLRNDVIRAETQEAQYRGAHNLIAVDKDATAVQQEMSVLSTQLATAEADEAAANARLAAFRANGGGGDDATISPVMRDLRVQQATLGSQRAELAGRYGPLHPDLAKVDRQLAEVNREIDAQSKRVIANLTAESRVATGRVDAIQGSLNSAKGGLSAGNNASVQLNELTRNSDSARSLYQSFLDRYRQALASQGTEQSNAYVIAHAFVPASATFPSLIIFGAGGVAAGGLAAIMVVLMLEMLERGFQNRRDVETKLGLPVVGTIPDLRRMAGVKIPRGNPMGPPDYLMAHDGSVFGEAFRSIRTALQLGSPAGIRSLAVTSALPGEGKTTAAMCIARSSAMAGLKVLLVDCDMRRRTSSTSMTGSVEAGMMEVLKGTASIEQAMVRDSESGVWVLPQTGRDLDYDLLVSPRMTETIKMLADQFDLVVLDTAPVLPLAEARVIASMADGVLLIARWRKTPVQAAQLAVELLGRADARIAGAALSQVDLKKMARAGEGDEMAYYDKFKSYYATS